MSDMNRRDFLKIAGAGSAVLAAIGAGVVATGKVFRADHASTGPNEPLTFRATAGLPQQPYPAYASLVTYLVPPVALAYGAVFLGEHFAAAAFGGLALILVGVALGSRSPRAVRARLREREAVAPAR